MDDNNMDWEIVDDVGEVAPSLTAQKIVSAVQVGETKVYAGDFDIESFSFESEEEDQTDEKGTQGVSRIMPFCDMCPGGTGSRSDPDSYKNSSLGGTVSFEPC